MTARPLDPDSRRRPLCLAVALVLVMAAVLLVAGCTYGKNVQERDNEKVRILVTSTIATTAAYQDIAVIDNYYPITTNPVSSLTVTTKIDGAYTIVQFVGAGTTTWTPPSGVSSVEYLVVAGGGGGSSGGGGAGGIVTGSNFPVSGNTGVTVGAGGTGNSKTSGV